MDPASIVGLVMTVGSVVETVMTYALDAKEATKDMSNLLTELLAVKGLLEQLQLDQRQSLATTLSSEFSNLLQSGLEVITELERDLGRPGSRTQNLLRQLKWPLKKDRLQKHIDMLERVKACCLLALVRQGSANDTDLKAQVWDIRRLLEQDREETQARRLDKSRQELLRWLAPVSTDTVHTAACQRHHAGTNSWLLRGPLRKFIETEADNSMILWLKGKSGSGKTVLMSQTVENLKCGVSHDTDSALAYFYCSFDNLPSHEPRNILGALMAQIFSASPDLLEAHYVTLANARNDMSQDLAAVLLKTFTQLSQSLSTVYIVIDAVNETTNVPNIASTLLGLTQSCNNLRFVFSSTDDMDLAAARDYCDIIHAEMDSSTVDSDISLYVNNQLAENTSLNRFTKSLQDKIATSILELAQGNFRYAGWQIEQIAAQPTGRDVQRLLRTLPHNLNESYSRLLNSTPLDSPEREYLRKALAWLCFAPRPLYLRELAEVVVLDEEDSSLDDDYRLSDPQILIQLARGTLDYNRVTGIVTLAHFSIRTCLTSEWIRSSPIADFAVSEASAHKMMLRGCLTYLLFDAFNIGYEVSSFNLRLIDPLRYPLLSYASRHWTEHLHEPDDDDGALLRRFLATRDDENGGNYGFWLLQILWTKIPVRVVQRSSPLYYAASLGKTSLVKAIIRFTPSLDVNAPGGMRGSSPIHVACFRGHREIAKLLVEAGADCLLDDPGLGHSNSALDWARSHRWNDLLAIIESTHPGITQVDASDSGILRHFE